MKGVFSFGTNIRPTNSKTERKKKKWGRDVENTVGALEILSNNV